MRTVSGEGPILVLRSPSDLHSEETTAGRCRGLRKACPDHVVIEAGPDPLGLGPPSSDFHILSSEDLAGQIVALSKQHPDAVAVVSLLFEFPPMGNAWARDLPPLYAFAAGPSRSWVKPLREGRLKAVVRYKSQGGVHEVPARGASAEDVFDDHFELLTSESLRERTANGQSSGPRWGLAYAYLGTETFLPPFSMHIKF